MCSNRLRRFLLIVLSIFAGFYASAQECQNSYSKPSQPSHIPGQAVDTAVDPNVSVFKSLDEAATAALQEASGQGKNKRGLEFGGCLFSNEKRNGTQFYYTQPVSNNSNDGFKASCLIPTFAPHLVGIYHTHPAEQTFDGFSEHDLNIADYLNVTSYIASMYTKNIRRYVSCKTKKMCLDQSGGLCRNRNFSPGEQVSTVNF